MEVYNNQRRQQGTLSHLKTRKKLQFQELGSCIRKPKSTKSNTMFDTFSRSRIRRINSIEENITGLFKQNQAKLNLYLQSNVPMSDTITTMNLQNPDMFSILTDGVYVLVQGCVKMIVFDEEHPTYKSNMKEITSNTFRKLRINKELGIRTRDTGSEHIKKFLVSEKSEQSYTLATFEEPFSVFQCVNENCLCYSTETMVYKLDDEERKMFKYEENKQKLHRLFEENRTFFKTHSMLYHSFAEKKFPFRNQFKVDNVALIKRGSVRVMMSTQHQNKKSSNLNTNKLICELGQSSLLVKGFIYQISSFEADILFILKNETFELIKYPQWVNHFNESGLKNMDAPKQLKKKPLNLKIKKQYKKVPFYKNSLSGYLSPLQPISIDVSQQEIYLPKQNDQNDTKASSVHQDKNHKKRSSEVPLSQISTQSPLILEALSQKSKKIEFLKMISPYVMISQKIGLKEIMKTRNILNERSLNISPLKFGKESKINKLSKIHIDKYTSEKSSQKLSLHRNQRTNLLRFQKYLQQHNHKQYEKKINQSIKKHQKNHRKSVSELTTITSANFHLSLKKHLTTKSSLQFKSPFQSKQKTDKLQKIEKIGNLTSNL